MKRIIYLIFLLNLLLIFFSCKPSYHYGYMGTENAPLLNNRESGFTNYSGIGLSTGGASNEDEKTMTAKLLHQTNYTYDFFSISAHAETYYGYHSIEAVEEYKGKTYNYYGIAPQMMASIFYPFKAGRWGVYSSIGTFWEFGSYPDWLENTENDSLFIFNKDDYLGKIWFGGVGILHEVIHSEDKMLSFQLGIGKPGFIHSYTSFHNKNYIITVGLSAHLESGSLFVNYMRKW